MPTLPVYNMNGEQTGEIALNDSVFDVKVNEPLLHQAVLMQLASKRHGTAKAKTRSEVRGGGRKPWRQKGTGRARHGSRRSPLWTGGGIVFPPNPRDYKFKLPKKARRLALKSALSAKVDSGELIIMEKLDFAEPKTKAMVKVLENLKISDQKALIVQADTSANANDNITKSARNIPGVSAMKSDGLNVYDILFHDQLILTKEAIGRIEEALA